MAVRRCMVSSSSSRVYGQALALWRGWVDDVASTWRIFRREARNLLFQLASDYSGFRWVISKLKLRSSRSAISDR